MSRSGFCNKCVTRRSTKPFTKPLLALTTAWPAVLLLRFMDRLGKGIRASPRDALIAETTPTHLRGRAFGLHRSMDTSGAVLGPLLGLWFLTHISSDLRKLFLFAGIPGLLAVATLLFAVRETKQSSQPKVKSTPSFLWKELDPVIEGLFGRHSFSTSEIQVTPF